MAVKTPIRGEFSGSDLTGFAEFQASDFIGIADGGTGAITAAGARTALGIAIGSDVQAYDAQLTDVAGLAVTDGGFIVGDGSNFVLETGNTARASLGLGTSDSPTFNGLTLSGNLIVNGTTTTINSTTTTLDDPIMTLGGDTAPSSDDNKDRGIEFRYYSGGSAKLGFFGFDDSSGKFTFIPDATNTSEVFSGTAGTLVANLEGNVTGTVSSLSGLDTDNLSEGSSNLYFTNERVDDRVNALIIGGAGVDTAYDDSAGTLTLTADLSEVTSDLNERVDDRVGSLLVDSATSGIDIAYDDASDQLTISADLSEITSDLNERIDDQVNSVLTAGSNVSLTYDDAAGTLTIASTDTNTQLTQEQVEDFVGGMLDGTETFITVDYDDTNGNIDFVVPVKDEDDMASDSASHLATQQSIKAYVDAQIATEDTLAELNDTNITSPADASLLFYDTSTSMWIDNVVSGDITIADTGVATIASGAVDNAMLANSTISFGGVSLALGASDGTPAFDLTDATNYPTSSLTGTITNAQLAGSIANSKLANSSITVTDGSNSTATALGGTITFSGTSNEVDVAESGGTITIGLPNDVTIAGDLTVSGTTTTVNSTTVTIDDPLVRYADNNSGNSVDFGFYGKYVQSATTKYGGLVWDASQTDKFRLFHGNQSEPSTTVDVSGTGHTTGTLIANIEGNVTGNVTGDVTGNADTATALATARTIHGVSFDGSANIDLSEVIQDTVGAMFGSNTETRITVSYEDGDGTIDLVVDNDLANYDNTNSGFITATLTQEQVEDYVGGMLDGDETFITVAYDDTDGNIDFTVPVKDEDNMASDSASHLATQQSIKAYVDSQVTAQDLDFAADSGGALAIDLDSETLTLTGGTGIDTSGSGNTVTFAIDSTVVTESSTDTLTNKTVNLENNTVIVEYAVTVAGGKFVIDGESQATISFRPGVVHRFDLSDSSTATHPFVLSTTSEGSAYTTGRTANGTQGQSGAYIEFTVNAATPDILYYYCSSHSGMGGTITVFGSAYGDADVQSYLSAGTGITLSGSGVIASSITQYADSDVQSYLSGGTGVTMSGSGEFSIGQAVATTSDVTFADLAATGNVTITGNLDVNGTTTTLDTTNSTIADRLIELGTGTTGTPANDMGIVLERGSSDNAFIGWDESADKFIVGTGSFTGASTGNLTITTGTLVANVEGNVTGNVSGSSGSTTGNAATATALETARTIGGVSFDGTANINLPGVNTSGSQDTSGNAATATALATGRTIGMTGDVVWTSASFDGSGNVTGTAAIQNDAVETAMVNSNVITGQSAYSGTVDTTNDFVLIYDHSTTSLKKIAVSDLNSASGAGTMSNFTIAADSGSNQVVADANTLTLTGGTGIDTSVGGTDEVTFAVNTEAIQDIVGAMFTGNTETNITVTYEDGDGTIDLVATGNTTEEIQDIVGAMFSSNTETNITATYQDADGTIDLAADLLTEEAVEDFVAGMIVGGTNMTATYDDAAGTLTLAATGGAANAFSTLAVSGQSNVVADASTDTLTLVAGTGMTLTTDASADSITFASTSTGGGSMPFTEFDGTTDDIVLSSQSTGGALPVTLAGGTSDPIAMTSTQQTMTAYADADDDTKIEVERTTDNDTVHIKAGGTDVITATATGVTITNLTVSGTTTQANELKITDTLFELNADGGSLTTDAGMIVERGSTGDNAALIWDESADAWVAGTTATDGSASSNLTVTEGDLKAKTQNQSDNSTKVATTSYVDTAVGNLSSNSISDADSDTKIQVEEGSDEDIIRADTGGQERVTIDNNVSMSARGGFFTHNATLHSSETFTIASTEGTVAAGPLDVQGTVDVQGTLVVV